VYPCYTVGVFIGFSHQPLQLYHGQQPTWCPEIPLRKVEVFQAALSEESFARCLNRGAQAQHSQGAVHRSLVEVFSGVMLMQTPQICAHFLFCFWDTVAPLPSPLMPHKFYVL